MKTLTRSSVVVVLFVVLVSFSSKRIELFDVISIQVPSSLISSEEYDFVNVERWVVLEFRITENMQYQPTMPKVDFDIIYNLELPESYTLKDKEIKEMSGLKIGIISIETDDESIMMFFTEIKGELLSVTLSGKIKYTDYIEEVFYEILNSVKKS